MSYEMLSIFDVVTGGRGGGDTGDGGDCHQQSEEHHHLLFHQATGGTAETVFAKYVHQVLLSCGHKLLNAFRHF